MKTLHTARAWRHAVHAQTALALLLAACWPQAVAAEETRHRAFATGQNKVRIEILYPCDDATVFDSDGKINVEIAVMPSLVRIHGTRIELSLDGRKVRMRNGDDFVLPEIDGGLHYLRARLIGGGGAIVGTAEPVRFYYWPESAPERSH